jgi:FkbM family methyltransferase
VSLVHLLKTARAQLKDWWWLLPTTAVLMPGRLPPKKGVGRFAHHEVAVRTVQGDHIRCRIDETYGLIEVYAMRIYDAEEIEWDRLSSVVDIGANIGAASIWFARRCPAKLLAVEPAPDTCSRLEVNLRRNGLRPRVEVLQAAVGNRSGRASIQSVVGFGRDVDNSRLRRTVTVDRAGTNTVPQVDLDTVINRAGGAIDLMKVDCEGAEYMFLTGASAEALKKVGIIIGEYHPAPEPVQQTMFARLRSAGFQCRITPLRQINGLNEGLFLAQRRSLDSRAGLG